MQIKTNGAQEEIAEKLFTTEPNWDRVINHYRKHYKNPKKWTKGVVGSKLSEIALYLELKRLCKQYVWSNFHVYGVDFDRMGWFKPIEHGASTKDWNFCYKWATDEFFIFAKDGNQYCAIDQLLKINGLLTLVQITLENSIRSSNGCGVVRAIESVKKAEEPLRRYYREHEGEELEKYGVILVVLPKFADHPFSIALRGTNVLVVPFYTDRDSYWRKVEQISREYGLTFKPAKAEIL